MATAEISGLRGFTNDFYNTLGTVLRVRYFNYSIIGNAGSYYDDAITLTLSGTTYTSGLHTPVGNSGMDAILKHQGKILEDDSKFYIPGNVQTSGLITIGIGSPPPSSPREYSIVPVGTIGKSINDGTIYKVVYGRFLTNGSLL